MDHPVRVLSTARARLLMLVAASAGLLLVGCSRQSPADQASGASPDPKLSSVVAELDPSEEASPLNLDEEDRKALARGISAPSPLEELLTSNAPKQLTYSEAVFVVTDCMEAAGFDHVPYDPSGSVDLPDDLTDEYVVNATVGYGISTFLGREPVRVASGGAINPNAEIYNSLTDEEREAYDQEIGRCQIEAGLVIADEDVDRYEAIWAELDQLQKDVDAQIDADSRVIEARHGWQMCMAEAGYEYRDRDEIYAELQSETQATVAAIPALAQGAFVEDLEPDQQRELADLQVKERTIAQADLLCRTELDEILWATRIEVENNMIEDDSARIDRLVIAMAEAAES